MSSMSTRLAFGGHRAAGSISQIFRVVLFTSQFHIYLFFISRLSEICSSYAVDLISDQVHDRLDTFWPLRPSPLSHKECEDDGVTVWQALWRIPRGNMRESSLVMERKTCQDRQRRSAMLVRSIAIPVAIRRPSLLVLFPLRVRGSTGPTLFWADCVSAKVRLSVITLCSI